MAAVVSTLRSYTANGVAVPLIVVVRRIDIGRIEVEVVAVRGIVDSRGPVIAVGTLIVERPIVPVAAIKTKQPQ